MTTYVVINNTPGYLPEDDDPGTYESLDEAKEALREEVERYLDDDEHLLEASFSADGETAFVHYTDRTYDLGRVFEVVTVPDALPA